MSRRGAVLRGVSKHQSYTIAEIAFALRKCRGTVERAGSGNLDTGHRWIFGLNAA